LPNWLRHCFSLYIIKIYKAVHHASGKEIGFFAAVCLKVKSCIDSSDGAVQSVKEIKFISL
jgi:hypothetical protein